MGPPPSRRLARRRPRRLPRAQARDACEPADATPALRLRAERRGGAEPPYRTEGGILVRRAQRKLVQVRLADEDRSRLPQVRDRRRAPRGQVPFPHARRRGRRRLAYVEENLDGT